MVLSDPPPYTDAPPYTQTDNTDQTFVRSASFVQSPTSVISRMLSNVNAKDTLPSYVSETWNMCSICLENMDEEAGNLFRIPACLHVFHKHCIEQWKRQKDKCPRCRGPISVILDPPVSVSREPGIPKMEIKAIPAMRFDAIPERKVDDIHEMKVNLWQNRLCLLPGMVYPLCLVFLTAAFELVILGLLAFPFVFFAFYASFVGQGKITNAKEFCEFTFCTFILFPLLYALVGVYVSFVLLGQIIYMLYRTMKFYNALFACQISWTKAFRFIVVKSLISSWYYIEQIELGT